MTTFCPLSRDFLKQFGEEFPFPGVMFFKLGELLTDQAGVIADLFEGGKQRKDMDDKGRAFLHFLTRDRALLYVVDRLFYISPFARSERSQ